MIYIHSLVANINCYSLMCFAVGLFSFNAALAFQPAGASYCVSAASLMERLRQDRLNQSHLIAFFPEMSASPKKQVCGDEYCFFTRGNNIHENFNRVFLKEKGVYSDGISLMHQDITIPLSSGRIAQIYSIFRTKRPPVLRQKLTIVNLSNIDDDDQRRCISGESVVWRLD